MSRAVNVVVDRMHVGRSYREVVQAVRARLRAKARRDPALQLQRARLYRLAILRHRENREMYVRVMRGCL